MFSVSDLAVMWHVGVSLAGAWPVWLSWRHGRFPGTVHNPSRYTGTTCIHLQGYRHCAWYCFRTFVTVICLIKSCPVLPVYQYLIVQLYFLVFWNIKKFMYTQGNVTVWHLLSQMNSFNKSDAAISPRVPEDFLFLSD